MKITPEVPENTTSPGIKAKFVLLSLIGIFMFFVPVPSNGATTIPIEYLVSFLTGHFMGAIICAGSHSHRHCHAFHKKDLEQRRHHNHFHFYKNTGSGIHGNRLFRRRT